MTISAQAGRVREKTDASHRCSDEMELYRLGASARPIGVPVKDGTWLNVKFSPPRVWQFSDT